jgi:hypothetical protein
MKKKHLTLAFLVLLSVGMAAAQDKSADLAIVVNESSLVDGVSSAELTKIFRMERTRSPGGFRYVVAVRNADSPEGSAALKDIYHMTDPEYEKFFLQATFTGNVQAAPKALTSAASVREFIASSPGAISYVRASESDASVKILKVDGKSPGDPGYPIKINGSSAR